MWDGQMDGAEFRLWGVALNRDDVFFVGRSVTVVAEK
jgi:hypothetical protein